MVIYIYIYIPRVFNSNFNLNLKKATYNIHLFLFFFYFHFLFFIYFLIFLFVIFLFFLFIYFHHQLMHTIKHFHNFHLKLYTLKTFVMRTKTNLKPYMFRSVRRSSSGVISRALYHYYLSI